MQAVAAPTRPAAFTAARKPSARPATRLHALKAVAQQQPESEAQWRLQRRSLASLLAAAPALLPASRALALLPDDDDEELIEKAKAGRKARLAAERETQRAYERAAGYVSRADEKSLISVQKAVNSLAKSGSQLEAGDLPGVASAVSEAATELRSASSALSFDDASQSSADKLLASLSSLESAAKGGDARGAKKGFVAAVGALQSWVGNAGIKGSIKGL
ncbi:hypothetical protein N2152v2_010512 [Parachlorella kessleri]